MQTIARPRMGRFAWLAAAAAVFGAATSGWCGSLTPPPGPIAPTMKPLNEVEPRTVVQSLPGSETALHVIAESGSYYLAGNVRGEPGRHGVEIRADHVEIDLRGFVLTGVEGTLDAVHAGDGVIGLSIRDGSILGWGGVGVAAWNADSCRVARLHVSRNRGAGLVAGPAGRVSGCTAADNAGAGIICAQASTVVNCVAVRNRGNGIAVQPHSSVLGCVAESNEERGIETLDGCVVERCVASVNGADGIYAGAGTTVAFCASFDNEVGVLAEDGCVVRECNVRENRGDGIFAWSSCRIGDNLLFGNGTGNDGAGLRVSGSGNRIERNHCTGNGRGLDCAGDANLVVGNSASGNATDFVIAEGNVIGEMLDLTGGGTLASGGAWTNVRHGPSAGIGQANVH